MTMVHPQAAERAGVWIRTWLLAAAVGAGALVAACGSNSSVATSPTQVKCQVALDTASPTIGPDGGAGTVTVTTSPECPWDVSAAVSWLTGLSPTSGQGSGTVDFLVGPNPLPTARVGDIVINDTRLRVSQQPAACTFEVRPDSLEIDAAGGTRDFAVVSASGCAWTVATDAGWLSITTATSGSGPGSVGVRIAPNPTDSTRTGTITLGSQRVTVTQAGAVTSACTYNIGLATTVSVPAAGATGAVAVSTGAGCAWTATSSVPWITVTSGASGEGPGVVAFSVAANLGAARTAILVVAGETFTATQAAAAVPCTYGISSPDASIAASGGNGTFSVSTGTSCVWSATSNAAWVTVTSGGSGTGSGPVSFSVAANTGSARTGTITVAGQTFTVRQAAAAVTCSYAISATNAAIAASGGSGTVGVSAGAACGWTATSNAAWLTVTSGSTGGGNGLVAFSVAANPGGARTGTITVAGQTFTVTQAAAVSCAYTISPATANVDDKGGTRTVTVSTASGCAWTARSDAPSWITVTSGASGTGSGSVQVLVDRNTGNARTGTVTIAGQTFTVTQRQK